MPAAFIGLPIAGISLGLMTDGCLGAFLWCLIAVALAGATLVVVLQAWLRPRARLIGAASLVGVGAAIFLVAIPFTPSYYVDASLWRTYASPNGDFRVLLPGQPKIGVYGATEKYVVDVKNPEISFAVFVAPDTSNPNNMFGNNNWQRYNEAKTRLEQTPEYSTYNLYYAQERDLYQSGQMCHELIYNRVTLRYSNQETKTLVARIFVVNGKVYTLAALGPRVKADGADVIKFFTSFQPIASPVVQPPVNREPASPVGMPGLLAYWSFDGAIPNPAAAGVNDESGNLLLGTAHQATTLPGKRGSAIHFAGRGSYFDFNTAPTLNFQEGDDFSCCGWVRTQIANGAILSNRARLNGGPVIDAKIEAGKLTAEVRQDGNEINVAVKVVGKVINDGQWHHFAMTRKNLGPFGVISLYIDGEFQGNQQGVGANGPITTDMRALGAELYWQQKRMANADFIGDMDEFCIFNRALDVGNVKKLAGAGP